MRKQHENRRTTNARPSRHAVRTAAGIVQARQGQGYTADEHARALDKLIEDIASLDGEETSRTARSIEPKLRMTRRMAAEDIVAPNAPSVVESAALRIA